jgi:hypothetical protein
MLFCILACCRRDRLATTLQLLLPVLLVFAGLYGSRVEMFGRDQPPLLLSREMCMNGRKMLLAVSPVVLQQQTQQLQQFVDAYPRCVGCVCAWQEMMKMA